MASIIQIRGKWRAQVRRTGFPPATKTFVSEDLARAWAADQEDRVKMLTADVLIDPTKSASKYRIAGVYMLILGREVRYIGRSSHIYRRLNDHSRKDMDWDRFRVWPCRDSIAAADLESKMIQKYQPVLNVALREKSKPKRRGKNPDIFSRYQPAARISDNEWGDEQ